MTSRNFQQQWAKAFPELQQAYGQLASDYVFENDGQPGNYIVTAHLFAYYIEILLALPESPKRDLALQKAFDFIETMLSSGDDDVIGLAQIGIIEGREQWWFQRAMPFVGPLWRYHASRMGEPYWEVALSADAADLPLPIITLYDLFGVRETIARQLIADGVLLEDIPVISDITDREHTP